MWTSVAFDASTRMLGFAVAWRSRSSTHKRIRAHELVTSNVSVLTA